MMSSEHHTHDDQRLEPHEPGEQVEHPGIQVVSAAEMKPASVIAEIPGDDAVASDAASDPASGHEQRWHDVLASFVDDPRGAVLAATELVVNDVSAFVAVLDQRRKSMLNAPAGDQAITTEDLQGLRQAAATYRDISKQLTASIQALKVTHRGYDAAGRRQVTPPPREPSSQDQRR